MKFNVMRYALMVTMLTLFLSSTTLCSTNDLLVKLTYKVLTVEERMDNLETQFQSAFDGLELRLNNRLDKMTGQLGINTYPKDSEVSNMKQAITTAVAKIVQSQYTVLKNFMKGEKEVLSETKHLLQSNVTNLNTVIEQALMIYDEKSEKQEKLLARNVQEMRSGFDDMLKTSTLQTESELDKQARKIQELSQNAADVESQVTSHGHQLSEHASQLSTTQRNLRVYQSSCSSVSDHVDILENKTGSFVSFSTKLAKGMPHTPSGTIIKFSEVINNYGSHYNTRTGKFTAPVSGIYVFIFYIASYLNSTAHVGLYVDETLKMAAISVSSHEKHDETGGNSVIVQLLQGQEVYIKTYTWPDKHHIWGGWKTSLSGALLYAD